MKTKKTLAALMVGAMVLTASPAVPASLDFAATAYAAKGGAKFAPSAPKAAPAAPKASTGSTGAGKSVSGNGAGYAPSKDAKSLDKNAPAANANAANRANAAGTQANQSSSRLGSIMRGIGLFAGGMFLGSMLSSLFGMGSGMFADIMGLLMNGLLIVAAIFVIRWLWGKLRGSKGEASPYRQSFDAPAPRQSVDAAPRQSVRDIQPPKDAGYSARQTADRYRNR